MKRSAKRIIEQCEKHRISLLPIENPLYPKRARNCNDAPIILYYKGTIQRMDKTVGFDDEELDTIKDLQKKLLTRSMKKNSSHLCDLCHFMS